MTQAPLLSGSRVFKGDNPFDVDPASDAWVSVPDGPDGWSETMFFSAYDVEHHVGIWVHCGREREDKGLWWVHTIAFLPDGVVLADRSFSRLQDGGGNATVTCVEPLKKWRVTFDGAGELTSTDQMAAGPLPMGVPVPFRFEFDFDAVAPIFDMHRAMTSELDWGMGGVHHEQGHRVTGSLTAQGKTWQIDCGGMRDHSAGPRDFTDFGGHTVTFAVWPESGRTLFTFLMWRPDDPTRAVVSIMMLMENGTTEITHDFEITGKTAAGGYPRKLELNSFRTDGTPVTLTGEVLHNATVTYAEPNLYLIGNHGDARHGMNDPIIADESIVQWTWPDGEIGIANYERGVRPSNLPIPVLPLPAESPFHASRESAK